jgi:ankyrin repeat protein
VACQLDLLCGLPNDTAMRQAIDSLPPTLFETYERLLERVDTRHTSVKQMVQRTLRWIVHGQEPLSIAALCEAISIQDDDKTLHDESICEEEDILVHCSSLIRRTADGENLELAHFTVKEFLESLSTDVNSPLASYSQHKEHVLPYLAKTCLTFLTFEDFQGPVIEGWGEWQAQKSQYPFRSHAVEFWDQYVEDAGVWEDKIVFELIQTLFKSSKKSCFRSWIRDFVFEHVCMNSGINLFDTSDDYIPHEVNFTASTRCMCKGGITPLHIAAALGSLRLCEWLLDSGSSINQMSSLGSPIHCALAGFRNLGKPLGTGWEHSDMNHAGERRGKVLKYLMENSFNLPTSYPDHLGNECSWSKLAILSGIGCGRQHILVTLVAAGAKLDKGGLTGLEGWDQLDDAIGFDGESLEALLANLKETNQDAEAWSDLLHAVIPLDTPMPTDLLRGGITRTADLSVQELNELFYDAIRFDNIEVTKLLLGDDRLDPRAVQHSAKEVPAIHIAVDSDSLDTLEILLSSGLDIDITNEYGETGLHLAAASDFEKRFCISALLDYGASTTVVDQGGRSIWHEAAYSNNKTAMQLLLDRDNDKCKAQLLPDKDGLVPIFAAAYMSRADTFEILLLHFGDLENLPRISPEGLGLVHYAVKMDSMKLLQLLKAKGFDLSQQTDDGKTTFHFISRNVDSDILDLLIESGVDPSAPAHDGATPLQYVKLFPCFQDTFWNRTLRGSSGVRLLKIRNFS